MISTSKGPLSLKEILKLCLLPINFFSWRLLTDMIRGWYCSEFFKGSNSTLRTSPVTGVSLNNQHPKQTDELESQGWHDHRVGAQDHKSQQRHSGRASVIFIYSSLSAVALRLEEGDRAVRADLVCIPDSTSQPYPPGCLTCCLEKSRQPGGPSPGCYVQGCSSIIGRTVYMGITLKPAHTGKC